MSLCPNYCDCEPCEHGVPSCVVWSDCYECNQIALRNHKQLEHQISVERQKNRIIPMKHE